jgi:hypothetical protein
MRDEVLETIRGAPDRALAGGGRLTTFMDELEPELKRLKPFAFDLNRWGIERTR